MGTEDSFDESSADQFEQTSENLGGQIPQSEEVTEALRGVLGLEDSGDFGRMIDIGDRYLGLVTDAAGAKLRLAREVDEYAPVGTDLVAKTVNEVVAYGLTPVAYQNSIAVADLDEEVARRIGTGLADAAERAGILLLGGKLRVEPDIVADVDLVGMAAGVGDKNQVFPGEAATGDRLVGFPSSGIHSDGIDAARLVLEGGEEDSDDGTESQSESFHESLLEPTRLYSYLTEPLQEATVHAAVPITGRGWADLTRMGEYRYVVSEPFAPQAIFDQIREAGGMEREELYRTFNMGTGFVVAAPESAAKEIVSKTDGEIVGLVEQGSGVSIRGMEIA